MAANTSLNRALVVLGQCLNSDGSPPATLLARIDMAVSLSTRGDYQLVLFTGGDAAKVGRTEAFVMRELYERKLTERSVAPDLSTEVLCEETSTTTVWNALFCWPLLIERGITRVEIVTSDYHGPRSLAIFESIYHHLSRGGVDVLLADDDRPTPMPNPQDNNVNAQTPRQRFLGELQFCRFLRDHVTRKVPSLSLPWISANRTDWCHQTLQHLLNHRYNTDDKIQRIQSNISEHDNA